MLYEVITKIVKPLVVVRVSLDFNFCFFQSPNNSAIMGAAPPERLGVASGLMALSRNFGSTIGMPMMGARITSYNVCYTKLLRKSYLEKRIPNI